MLRLFFQLHPLVQLMKCSQLVPTMGAKRLALGWILQDALECVSLLVAFVHQDLLGMQLELVSHRKIVVRLLYHIFFMSNIFLCCFFLIEATLACNNPNEIFSTCGNDGCQRSCSRLDVTGCRSVCVASGCVCMIGFVRNSFGVCVLPSSCR